MKSLQDFKSILSEEEKQDFSKFDVLVRAGLANKAQINRLHRILEKMTEERPVFNPQDRQIMQNLFNKMVDLISNNKQIFTQTRRAVHEELEEGVIDTSDYKVGADGKKHKAHRVKVGDKAPQIGDDPEGQTPRYESVKEGMSDIPLRFDPPFTLVLKRKAIRQYPNDTKIALYYSDRLKTYFSVPYSNVEGGVQGPIQAQEQVESVFEQMQEGTVYHKNGKSSQIDEQTYDALRKVHLELNEENQKKFEMLIVSNPNGLQKAIDFCTK